MKTNLKYLLIIVTVLLTIGVAYGLTNIGKTNETSSNEPPVTKSNEAPKDGDKQEQTIAATITYTGDRFEPAKIAIKSGQTIEIINKSSIPLQFDSNPHPQHTDNEELNVDFIRPGSSQKIILTQKGTWSFHNHLNSSETGQVIVE